MITSNFISALLSLLVVASPVPQLGQSPAVLGAETEAQTQPVSQILAVENYSLTDRYKNTVVNDVFADNILLTLSYLSGQIKPGEKVNWDQVHAPSQFQFVLMPGKTFAFHDQILPEYQNSLALTTNADFSSDQGFKSDGYLVGDGVCHLASFLNVAASEAGLTVLAPTRHDFANIPDVDKKFGTAIYYVPGDNGTSARQNLYITNNQTKPVAFSFMYDQKSVKIVVELLQ